ncbi:MAG: membrane protein insertase YidC [Bacteroidota bacterium]
MDRNVITATVLIGLIMLGWMAWLSPEAPPPMDENAETAQEAPAIPNPTYDELEEASATLTPEPLAAPVGDSLFVAATEGTEEVLTVETSYYTAEFSTKGGTLTKFELKTYQQSDRVTPVQLIDSSSVGALGLFFTTPSSRNVDTRTLFFTPNTSQRELTVTPGDTLALTFEARIGEGAIRQTYTFSDESYEVGYSVEQVGADAFATREGYQLIWDGGVPFNEGDPKTEAQSAGAFVYTGGELERIDLEGDQYEESTVRGEIDWIGVKDRYFTVVVIPHAADPTAAELIGEKYGSGDDVRWEDYEMRLEMPAASAQADGFKLYLGPVEYYGLSAYDLDMFKMVDLGWDFFEPITRPMARWVFIPVFTFLERFTSNYGLIIIALAFLIKLVVYPFTKASYRSMAKMRELQPQMEAIKEKYGDDPQKQQKAMMAMYKESGANPLGGCLPMLFQYPIIIALWMFLPQAIQIRQEPFLWANDLSAPDVILSLPFSLPFYGDFVAGFTLLMGLSMVFQMKIQMASQPSTPQTKMMTYLFPVMIFVIFNRFASGLSLYYLCFNLLTAVQQKFINKQVAEEKDNPKPGKKANSKTKASSNGKSGRGGKTSSKSSSKNGKFDRKPESFGERMRKRLEAKVAEAEKAQKAAAAAKRGVKTSKKRR